MRDTLSLTGLDGANPLAFLAAVGLLRVLDERTPADRPRPRMRWREAGRWRPELQGVATIDDVVDCVLGEIASWKDEPALALLHEGAEPEDDLKPSPAAYRAFLESARERTLMGEARTARFAASFASELVQDNAGKTKPTALHFTAGQQRFLEMVRQLMKSVGRDHLVEALVGPWTGTSPLPSLSWDSTVQRAYALRASDPSKEKRGSVPGAEVLAFHALPFFPVVANERLELGTTCVEGGWKSSEFTWPLWHPWSTADVVRSLLALTGRRRGMNRAPFGEPAQRACRGVSAVFAAGILRSDQGGYGSFTPSRPV